MMKKAMALFLSLTLIFAIPACGRAEPKQPQTPDLSSILRDLDTLASKPRPIGSQGEQEAAAYILGRFEEMGYEVRTQLYTDAQGRTGTNVIAVKPVGEKNGDCLVISAHHDSAPTAPGANDNASGVTALLAVAELLKDAETDTELRFISFTDEENGKNGSRYYTDSLSQEDLNRMIGCIQLDMLGGLGTKGTVAATMDGQGNWISDLLTEQGLALTAETASDHASFQLAGVPSVLLTQNGRGYLYHTAADKTDQINLDAIVQAAEKTAQAVRRVADPATPSYQGSIRRNPAYRQTRQNVISFDCSVEMTEGCIGAAGELADHQEIQGDGWTDVYDSFRYSMLWFCGEKPMNTYYNYRNGFLASIEIRPAENGYSCAQVRKLMTAMYGAPTKVGTDREGRPFESWRDEIYSKYLTLTGDKSSFSVSVNKYSVGVSNLLAEYPVRDGQAEITDPKDAKVWDLLCSILPQEYRKKIAVFQLFTDGASNILAYTAPVREGNVTDNSRFVMTVDYYDVYDENGLPRDMSKLTYTLLHEYGHVLLEDNTQINLNRAATTHEPAGFIEGSFRKNFYDKFWADLGDSAVEDYEANPTHYVSRCGANYFHEDIADTFAIFLLGGKPEGDTVAEAKLNLFWQYPEMVKLRTAVRENLGLSLK